MSPLRKTRARPPGGVTPVATGLVLAALVLLTALLLVRAPAVLTARNTASDVCPPPPVPAAASCTSSTSTTFSTRTSTQSSSTESTSTTGTQTDTGTTSTSTGSTTTTTGGTTTLVVSGSSTRSAASASASPPASRFPPPPPPLPPAAPGSAPVSPETVVQRIVMVPAVSGPIAPGDTVEVQAILEAQRGTDIFAVPHVPVTFAIVSASGGGAAVTPTRVTSGETGVAMATVRTGDAPGDTVVSATSATVGAQLALHAEPSVAGAAARVAPPATPGSSSGTGGGGRVALVGTLAALGILGALSLGFLRRRGTS